jgi:hypothetical protein
MLESPLRTPITKLSNICSLRELHYLNEDLQAHPDINSNGHVWMSCAYIVRYAESVPPCS